MSRSSPGSKAREQHFRQKEQHLQSPHQSQGKKIRFYRLSSHSGEKNAFPMSVLVTDGVLSATWQVPGKENDSSSGSDPFLRSINMYQAGARCTRALGWVLRVLGIQRVIQQSPFLTKLPVRSHWWKYPRPHVNALITGSSVSHK